MILLSTSNIVSREITVLYRHAVFFLRPTGISFRTIKKIVTPNQIQWNAFIERGSDGLGVVVTPHHLVTNSLWAE